MIAKLIFDDYLKVPNHFEGKGVINTNPTDLEIGREYLVYGIWSSTQGKEAPGVTYYNVKPNYGGAFPMKFPAELFEIVENRIPSSYRLYQTESITTWFGICHPLIHPDNWDYLEKLWDGDYEALETLKKVEMEVILELGYEKYFPEMV